MPRPSNVEALAQGDRRSLGPANAVVKEVGKSPARFKAIFANILGHDPLLRVRSADVVEKVSRVHPALLQPFKEQVMSSMPSMPEPEARWHAAQMIPRLHLRPAEAEVAIETLYGLLQDRSRIVQVCALQSLFEMAQRHVELKTDVDSLLRACLTDRSAAVRARARKLLKQG